MGSQLGDKTQLCSSCENLRSWSWRSPENDPTIRYFKYCTLLLSLSKSADEGCKLCFILKTGFNGWAHAGYPVLSNHTSHTMRHTDVDKNEDEEGNTLGFILVLCGDVVEGGKEEDSIPSTNISGFQFRRGIFDSDNFLDLGKFDAGPFFQILGPVGKWSS
jgi:hypothetical protein